jgi:drug/metabolite transporter (DMT)-like permease
MTGCKREAMQKETLAKLMVAYSGVCWGLFWIPLRALESAGLDKSWAIVAFNGLPALLIVPLALWRWRKLAAGGPWMAATGIAMAATQLLYSLSLLNTQIVDALVLFYLNPVWAALMAWYFYGERMTPLRLLSVALAFLGMAIALNTGPALPLPKNLGDWLAVAAGFGWAAAIILLKRQQDAAPLDLTIQNFAWTGILLIPIVGLADWTAAPAFALMASQLWWLLPFILAVTMTGVYSSMWAVPLLPAGIVGLLYMTEISSGAISAALLAGEPFGWREATGIALITLAGALESLVDLWNSRRLTRQS